RRGSVEGFVFCFRDGDASLRSGVAAGVLRGLGGVGSVRGWS
ncbi:unnamed protein product, partial [Brassica rapa subsp. trilocularis]